MKTASEEKGKGREGTKRGTKRYYCFLHYNVDLIP